MIKYKPMKILFTGGGTGGSVTPLIAIYQELDSDERQRQFEFFWIGGKEGIEKEIVEKYNIKYYPIASGKLRRYFSFQNFIDPFRIIKGFFQSIKILRKTRPEIIVAAGSYISVPVVWAGNFLKIPVLVHQQDIQVGLANKLMSKRAKKITVSLEESLKNFPKQKTVFTGNPVRKEALEFYSTAGVSQERTPARLRQVMEDISFPHRSPLQGDSDGALEETLEQQDKSYIKNKYKLDDLPVVLFIGGGTGAEQINKAVIKHLEKILQIANVFHIAGKSKKIDIANNIKNIHRYYQFDFMGKDIFAIMNFADLVISRAGMSTLSELSVLGKPVIIIPIPNSHQEKNANIFYKNNAAIVYEQKYLEDDSFPELISELLTNRSKLNNLSLNIRKMMPNDAAKRVSEIVMDIIKS
ncbi:MAG: undecaprenyldiphospho-muramoylpentapeptide beta-N-acetylglucosaminyltransferase [bacterium]